MKPYLSLPRPWLIAHRGGAALAPENTLVAFDEGARHGAVCLELDVRLTRDGSVVVFHDADTARITGIAGTIERRTRAELDPLDAAFHFSRDGTTFPWRNSGVRIPTLEEVFARHPDLRLNIEAKGREPALAEALVAVIRRADAVERVCIGSGNDAQGERLRALLPDACHFLPHDAARRHLLTARAGRLFDALCPRGWDAAEVPARIGPFPLLGSSVVERLHARGLAVFVWTIDDEREMRSLLAMGVDGLMTDRPDRLARVLGG